MDLKDRISSFSRLSSLLTTSWITPLVRLGQDLQERDAAFLVPPEDEPDALAAQFETQYLQTQRDAASFKTRPLDTLSMTLLLLHWPKLLTQAACILLEVGIRVSCPVALRQLLLYLESSSGPDAPPAWQGWLLASALAASGFIMALLHNYMMWVGERTGFQMKQQAISAVLAKVLRLNCSALAQASSGHVINLVSKDAASFDHGITFWQWLLGAPVELCIVLVLLALELGWAPALAGTATSLAIIPLQSVLSRRVAWLGGAIAGRSDARVALTREALQAALALKMMAWEGLMGQGIIRIRGEEAAHLSRLMLILALNFTVQFSLISLAAFVTFAVYRAGGAPLSVPSVLYCLALLALPKLFMASFFPHSMNLVTEMMVSVRRLAAFLDLPEPPPPPAQRQACMQQPQAQQHNDASADYDSQHGQHHAQQATKHVQRLAPGVNRQGQDQVHAAQLGLPTKQQQQQQSLPAGWIELRGSHYSWGAQAGAEASKGDGQQQQQQQQQAVVLSGLQLRVAPGQLLGVCGAVGSGKSSLLAALLGELQPSDPGSGAVVCGGVAYCPQQPWLVAASVRDNITFGREFQEERYWSVIDACALRPDLAQLPAGDCTMVGERGVNLSGGQKARVELARAAYSGAAIQLLDDPLSAVDPAVAQHLFDRCIGPRGLLAGRTRVLVTHQVQFLPCCDVVLVLRAGRVAGLGSWQQLQRLNLPELASAANLQRQPEGPTDAAGMEHHQAPSSSSSSSCSKQAALTTTGISDDATASSGPAPSTAHPSAAQPPEPTKGTEEGCPARSPLIQAEEKAYGSVPWHVYATYGRYLGRLTCAALLVLLPAGQALSMCGDWWLSSWAAAPAAEQRQARWLWLYALLVALLLLLAAARAVLFFTAAVQAASALHDSALAAVLAAPLAFFHSQPVGRLLNRFSRDLALLDTPLPMACFDVLQNGLVILGAFVLVAVAVPVILPVFLLLALLLAWLRRHFVASSREVKRWEAGSRSPLLAAASELMQGLATIRAYGAAQRFRCAVHAHLSLHGSWWYAYIGLSNWVGFRLDCLAAATLAAGALLAMAVRRQVQPQLLGLALGYVLQLAAAMQWWVRQTVEVETQMTGTQRLAEYAEGLRGEGKGEEQQQLAAAALPPGWPRSGQVVYHNVTARYRPGLPPVLRGLSFSIAGGSRCGVVGRTGSGKSSLLLTLFRLIPIESGHMLLDGVDMRCLPLTTLRRQLAVIPQDPVLFSGSIRSNLDPWDKHSDSALWSVLSAVQLQGAVRAAGGLAAAMAEAGANLSTGQRQLVCLARALLQDAKVLALDEATANVDRPTDALIQQAIRAHFGASDTCSSAVADGGDLQQQSAAAGEALPGGRVVLVVAHRVGTVLGCDQVLVLDRGLLVESGVPGDLAVRPGGMFAGMVRAAN